MSKSLEDIPDSERWPMQCHKRHEETNYVRPFNSNSNIDNDSMQKTFVCTATCEYPDLLFLRMWHGQHGYHDVKSTHLLTHSDVPGNIHTDEGDLLCNSTRWCRCWQFAVEVTEQWKLPINQSCPLSDNTIEISVVGLHHQFLCHGWRKEQVINARRRYKLSLVVNSLFWTDKNSHSTASNHLMLNKSH